MSILERLEQMERRLADLAAARPPQGGPPETPPGQVPGATFEARLVAVCEALMARPGRPGGGAALGAGAAPRGMTLLHLAAAQGYAGLVDALRRWRALAAESLALQQEADPLSVDHFCCTPLMWACALGHARAAERLWRWDGRALAVPDSRGRLPLAVARARGHRALAARLEELRGGRPGTPPPPGRPPPGTPTGTPPTGRPGRPRGRRAAPPRSRPAPTQGSAPPAASRPPRAPRTPTTAPRPPTPSRRRW